MQALSHFGDPPNPDRVAQAADRWIAGLADAHMTRADRLITIGQIAVSEVDALRTTQHAEWADDSLLSQALIGLCDAATGTGRHAENLRFLFAKPCASSPELSHCLINRLAELMEDQQ